MINTIRHSMEAMSERSQNIIRHIGWSMIFKLGSILANFMVVPLAITYLGNEDYGVWLTLSSVLTWFMLFDIGLGNGLRNKFAEARALGNDSEARAFVSTAYFTIAIIGTALVLTMWLLNSVVDWTIIFNTPGEKADELKVLMPVVFGFFGMQLVVKLITSIYQADQHHSIQDKIQFFTQTVTLIGIALLLQSDSKSLLLFGSIYMALPVLVLLTLNGIGFAGRYKPYRPSLSFCKKQHLGQIAGLGLRFFIIQIAAMVLFSTDNFIITQLFGPAEVVPYNIAFKYFSVVTLGYGIFVAPFWSSFTEAWAKNDMVWIKKSVSTIQNIWLMVPVALTVLLWLSDYFYAVWVGDKVLVPFILSLWMAVFVGLQTAGAIYTSFINGIGAIKVQLLTATSSMVINVPLSVFLASNLGLGSRGVIMATCFCLSYGLVFRFIQYKKIMAGSAKGLWVQ